LYNDYSKYLYNKLSILINKNRCNNCFTAYNNKNSIYGISIRKRVDFALPKNSSFITRKVFSALLNQGRVVTDQKAVTVTLWCNNCNSILELEMPYH